MIYFVIIKKPRFVNKYVQKSSRIDMHIYHI